MTTMDFLAQKKNEIADRIAELLPIVAEYQRLEAASKALDDVAGQSATESSSVSNGGGQPVPSRRPRSHAATGAKRGRPKGTGKRRDQALELVKATPGITIPEIAEKLGIKQNYLYRVLPGLVEEGLVVKDGLGWRPKAVE